MSRDATMTIKGQTTELKILSGTLGTDVVTIQPIAPQHFSFDPGFKATASCESKITYIDGTNGILLYRGYPINQLADQCDYMEVCHALMYGDLPTSQQYTEFTKKIKEYCNIHEQMTNFYNGFRRDAHPMAIMVGVVGALSAFYHDSLDIQNPAHRELSAIRLVGKISTIGAMCYKYTKGQPFVHPNKEMSYAENFLNMMFATPYEKSDINPVLVKAMDQIFTLHADHEQNASTSTVRVAGSTGANPFACIASGIAALWGPAHGGANEACLNMLKEIGSIDNIPKYIAKAKDKADPFRLMGFGHRVYKNFDPRSKGMQKTCHDVLEALGLQDDPLFKLAMALEKYALEDPYFIEKKLYPNVDFYSGITLSAIGIPTNMFTVIFAIARTVGWVSQWMEMISDPKQVLARPRQLYTGSPQRNVTSITERQE